MVLFSRVYYFLGPQQTSETSISIEMVRHEPTVLAGWADIKAT
jgi:hypothetical protein